MTGMFDFYFDGYQSAYDKQLDRFDRAAKSDNERNEGKSFLGFSEGGSSHDPSPEPHGVTYEGLCKDLMNVAREKRAIREQKEQNARLIAKGIDISFLEKCERQFRQKYPLDSRLTAAISVLRGFRDGMPHKVIYNQIDIARKVLSDLKKDIQVHSDVSPRLYGDVAEILDALYRCI